jgi:hypothetical protein
MGSRSGPCLERNARITSHKRKWRGKKGTHNSPYEDPNSFFKRRHDGVDENFTIHCPLTSGSEQGFDDGLGGKENKHGDPFN